MGFMKQDPGFLEIKKRASASNRSSMWLQEMQIHVAPNGVWNITGIYYSGNGANKSGRQTFSEFLHRNFVDRRLPVSPPIWQPIHFRNACVCGCLCKQGNRRKKKRRGGTAFCPLPAYFRWWLDKGMRCFSWVSNEHPHFVCVFYEAWEGRKTFRGESRTKRWEKRLSYLILSQR